MAGTDSTYIGMAGFTASRGNVGSSRLDSNRGNPNGDVVDNTQEDNPLNNGTLRTDPSTARGAYIGMQAKAPEIQP